MKLVTIEEMRRIEAEADANGLPYAQMMENAGLGVADIAQEFAFGEEERSVLALVGPGNNGGDALVALTYLVQTGWQARAYLVKRKTTEALVKRAKEAGVEILAAEKDKDSEQLTTWIGESSVVLDGVLGTGIKLPLKADVAGVLSAANDAIAARAWPPYVIAVDCPSGMDCDTGEVADEVIPASVTVCMAAVKRGLLAFPAFDYVGEVRVADIGLPEDLPAWQAVTHTVVDEEMVAALLPERSGDAHKGTFGTALLAAGSLNYTGAALLAGTAAYRVGAGLVQMAVPGAIHTAIAGQLPEATWVLLPHEMGAISGAAAETLAKNTERATALLIGPGLGTEDTTKEFLENLLRGKVSAKKSAARIGFVQAESESKNESAFTLPPLVVDADGLRLLSKLEGWSALLPAGTILTPHPGEMSALTGLEKEAVQADRLSVALKYAAEWGHVVVLKGAFTVIAAPDGRAAVIPVATAALARAGTGDVLAGAIVGLRAQGMEAFDAAVAGAWMHAMAGEYAEERIGNAASVMAGDVLDSLSDVLMGMI